MLVRATAREQIAHVGAHAGDAEQPRAAVHQIVDLVDGEALAAHQVHEHARIEITGARAHRNPRRRREAHRGLDAASVAHRREARPVAEMSEDHPALRRRAVDARQLVHQELVRQAVEPVAAHARLLVAPRNGEQLRHARQACVERGVEAGDLRQTRATACERLDHGDLARKMRRVERAQAAQLGDDLGGHELRLDVARPAVHHPVPGGDDGVESDARREPVEHRGNCRDVILRVELTPLARTAPQPAPPRAWRNRDRSGPPCRSERGPASVPARTARTSGWTSRRSA